MMSESSCLFVMETDVAETQDDSELNVYDDLPSFDLGDELEKLKAEKRHLEEYVCSLKSDIESLKTAVAELTETKSNLEKNISALFLTAKAEIERKDRMIEELRTNTGNNRFRFRPYYDNKRRVMESSPLDNFPAKKGRYDEIIEKADKAPSKSTEGKPSDEQVDLAGKNDDKSDHRKPSNEHENKAVTHEKSDHDKYASNLKHSTANTDNITDQGKHSDGEERRSRHNESLHSPRSRSVPSRYDNKAAKTDTSDYDKQNSKHRESEELGSRHSESTRYHRSRSVPRSNDNNLDMAGKSNTSDCDKQDSKHQEAVEWRLRRLEFTDSGESKSVPRSDDSKSSKYGDKPDNRAAKSDTPERDRPSCKRSDDGDGKEQRPRRSESTPRHREATRSHRSRSGDKLGDRTIKSDLSDYDKRSIKRSDSEERRYRYPESTNPYHRGYRNGGNYRGQRRFRHFRGRGRPYNERKYSDERWNDYNNERRYPNDRRNSYEDDLYYNKYNYCSSRYSNKSDDRYNSRTRSDDTYDCRPERYDGFEEREYGNYNRNLRDDNQTAQYRDDNIVLCRDDDRGIQCRNDDGAVQCRDEEREFLHRDDERALVYEIGDGEVQYRDEDRTVQYRDDDRGLGYSEYMEAALYRDDKRSVYGDYDDHEGGDRYFRQELSDYNDPMYVDDELGRPLERPNRSRSNTPFSHEGNKAKNQIVRPKKLEPFAIEKEQDTQRSITPMPLPEDIEDPKDDTLQELVQGKNDSKNEATAKVDVTCAKQETVKTVERNEGCDKKPPKKRLKILEVMERRVRESRLLKESNNNSLNETTKKNRRSTDADCDKNSVTSSKSNRSDKSDKSSGKVKCGKGKISNTSNEEFTKVKSKSTKANKSENKLEVLCKSIIVGDAKQSISLSKKSVAEDIAGLKGTTLITDLKKSEQNAELGRRSLDKENKEETLQQLPGETKNVDFFIRETVKSSKKSISETLKDDINAQLECMFASMFAEDNRKSIKTCNRLKSPEDRKKQTDNLERLFCQGLKQSAVNKHSPDIKSQNTDSSGNGTEETGLQKNRQTLEMSRTDKSLVTPDVDATKPKAKTSEQLCKTDQLERGEGAKDSGQNTECKNMPIIGDDHADVTSQKKHKQNSLVTKQNAVTDKEACDPKEKNKFSDNNVGQPAEFDKTGTKTHKQIPARVNLKSRISPETSTQEAKENKGGKEDRSVENGQSSCSSNQTGSNSKPLKPSTCKKEFEEKVKRRKSEEATEDRSDKSKYEDKMKKVTEKLESLFGKEEEEYDIKLVNEEGRKSSSEDATDRDSKRNVKEMENVDVSEVEEASKTLVNLTKCSPKRVKDRKRKSCDKNNEERQQCTVPEANPISKDMDKTTMQVVLENICTKGQKESEETVDISSEQKSNKLSKTETKRDLEKGNKLTKDSRNLKCNKKKDVEKSEEAANTEVTDKSETNSKPMLTRSQVNQNQTQENVKDKGEKVVTSNDEQTLKALRTSPRKKVATQAGEKVTGTNTDMLLNDVEKPVGKTACPEIECLKPDKTSAEVASTSKVADENKTTDSNKSKTSLKLTESRGRVSNVKRKIKFCSIEGDKDTDGKPLGQNTLFNNPEKLNQISSSFVAKHSATKPSVKEDKPCKKIGTGIKDTAPSMNKQHSNTDTITETPLGNFGTKNSKVKGSRSETAPDTKIPSESISKQSKPLIEVDHVTSQRSAPIYSSSDSSSSEDTVIINKSHDTKIFEKKVDDVVKNYFKNLDQADNEKDKSVDTTDAPVVKKLEETSKAVGTESSEPKTSAVDKFSISNNSLGTQSNSDRSIIKRRITPTPVRDDKPVCSFENILTKNSQTFTAATVPSHQSPLQLTHEGDIPVLHLEENQIANMPTEMNINDKNIITLLDTMNISNIECDIPKFRSVCGDTSVNTEANTSKDNNGLSFENMIGKAVTSTPRVAAKPEEKTTTNSSSVSIAGGSNVSSTNSSTCNGSVPFVRRRRRVRLVMLD